MHVQELDVLFTVALWLVKKSNQFNHIYIAEKKRKKSKQSFSQRTDSPNLYPK